VARATATVGSKGAPLGALAHLLPSDIADRGDLVSVIASVRPVLIEQGTNGPLVLFIDDLHHLDSTSATLIAQLVDSDLVFLLATVRTAEPVPAGLDTLWQRARVQRIDLDHLDEASLKGLLKLVLGDSVEGSTLNQLWRSSEGNVLFLREFVLASLESGHLVNQRGVWRLVGPLVATPRLDDLVGSRLAAVDPAAAPVLDLLAVCEPIGLSTLEALFGRAAIEALDHIGVLTVRADGRRAQVMLAHPLYGDVLRARLPMLARRRLLLEHAERIESLGARRREDAIRVAVARLEATGWADPPLLERAARLARYGHDFAQVERLSRAAVADGITAEAGLLLGEALHELGFFGEAESVLAAAAQCARDDEVVVYIAEIRSRNLMWGALRLEDALAVNNRARAGLDHDDAIAELTMSEALLLTYAGRPSDALAVLEPVRDVTEPRGRAVLALAEIPALVGVGRSETAAERALQAYAEHSQLPDQIAIPRPGVHLITRVYALTEAGRLAEAAQLAAVAYDATPASAPPDALVWLAHQRGRVALRAGQIDTARRWLREALARCGQRRSVGPQRLVLSALATADACAGDATAAITAVTELEQLPPFGFVAPEQRLGPAWAQVAVGNLSGAREILLAAADDAARTGYRSSEAWLLHDVARLGDPVAVVERLARLASECEGAMVPAWAAHAAAATAGHPDGLVDAADRFETLGAVLLAAEAASEAAHAFQRDGDRRSAAALGVRANALMVACEGARTPALRTPVLVVALTGRERDVAALAAQGASSQQIAERLFLSVRTVNNHLQSVYSKLGISSRKELAGVLGRPDQPPTASF
jgi:ATP/maltotriose-dependent transcriptional regulator MalT